MSSTIKSIVDLACEIARQYSAERGCSYSVSVSADGEVAIESDEIGERIGLNWSHENTNVVPIGFWRGDKDCPSGVLRDDIEKWIVVVPKDGRWAGYEIETPILRKLALEGEEIAQDPDTTDLAKLVPLELLKAHSTGELGIIIGGEADRIMLN
jgi:hypothetical protein